jgi:hypothetical protein
MKAAVVGERIQGTLAHDVLKHNRRWLRASACRSTAEGPSACWPRLARCVSFVLPSSRLSVMRHVEPYLVIFHPSGVRTRLS